MKTRAKVDFRRPLFERAEEALQRAFQNVIEEHARMNLPLQFLKDGSIIEMAASELKKELDIEQSVSNVDVATRSE